MSIVKPLLNKWHYSSLEKIFIENRIYRDIEECETWESVIKTIDKEATLLNNQIIQKNAIIAALEIDLNKICKTYDFVVWSLPPIESYIKILEIFNSY